MGFTAHSAQNRCFTSWSNDAARLEAIEPGHSDKMTSLHSRAASAATLLAMPERLSALQFHVSVN
jgi:hypothetical protein